MTSANSVEREKLKLFISYSRQDELFAEELRAGLEMAGFAPILDKHDVAAGEDWELRLGRLIDGSDTVVFVISPDAVASKRCEWELSRATEMKKRLLPIVWRQVEESHVPIHVRQLNYIFFDQKLKFMPALSSLIEALQTDVQWIREHTRIGVEAARWNGHERSEALLFRGEELAAAKSWLGAQPEFASEPTLLHHEFIKASEDAQTARAAEERKRLDQISAAQDQRAASLKNEEAALQAQKRSLFAVGGLLACFFMLLVGWLNQEKLSDLYQWRIVLDGKPISQSDERAIAQSSRSFRECASCPEMVIVPAGSFVMGAESGSALRANEKPRHTVNITRSYAVGRYEVTFAEWDACVSAGGCKATKNPGDEGWGRGRRPVINVSWDDAQEYVSWLSRVSGKPYRMLSEAEWEYAARGSVDATQPRANYPWGNEIGEANANCSDCGTKWDNKQTAPVGSFKPNPFGLYDMHGNVWEWVEDVYSDNYDNATNDGTAVRSKSLSPRVVRGGGWQSVHQKLRSAYRGSSRQIGRGNETGFRVARSLLSSGL